ncbi:hypothetical protein DsansV1_C37g0232741 [Dioscorea sansibarensis]
MIRIRMMKSFIWIRSPPNNEMWTSITGLSLVDIYNNMKRLMTMNSACIWITVPKGCISVCEPRQVFLSTPSKHFPIKPTLLKIYQQVEWWINIFLWRI